jgi:hypothetical protein
MTVIERRQRLDRANDLHHRLLVNVVAATASLAHGFGDGLGDALTGQLRQLACEPVSL